MANVIWAKRQPHFDASDRKSDDKISRYIAIQRGLDVYLSSRLCAYHGPGIIRDLSGCCVNCLAEGSSRSRARR